MLYQITNICEKYHHDTKSYQSVNDAYQLVIRCRWVDISVTKELEEEINKIEFILSNEQEVNRFYF